MKPLRSIWFLHLTRFTSDELDDGLRDALQDRAARDAIRQVRLRNSNRNLTSCNSVISSIVTKGEENRSSSVESFILQGSNHSMVDISDFFTRYSLPKLKCLPFLGARYHRGTC